MRSSWESLDILCTGDREAMACGREKGRATLGIHLKSRDGNVSYHRVTSFLVLLLRGKVELQGEERRGLDHRIGDHVNVTFLLLHVGIIQFIYIVCLSLDPQHHHVDKTGCLIHVRLWSGD